MKVASIMEDLMVRATSGQDDRPTGNCPIRFGTVNIGTISRRGNEVVEMLTPWKPWIFVACRSLDGKDWPIWSKEGIASISYFGVEISQVL